MAEKAEKGKGGGFHAMEERAKELAREAKKHEEQEDRQSPSSRGGNDQSATSEWRPSPKNVLE